jgi:hypothetical protein
MFLIEKENDRTVASYADRLKARMVLNIEDTDEEDDSREKTFEWSKSTTSSERTYSFDESDV